MAERPADLVGLRPQGPHRRRAPTPTSCVFAPDDAFVVDPTRLQHKNPVSAYGGRALAGSVRSTWLAGTPIDIDAAPRGRLLRRGL